jgi:hypothetical protein
MPLTKGVFRGVGTLLLFAMVVLPTLDAVMLLENFNYTFWVGRNMQVMLITAFAVAFVLLFFVSEVLFSKAHENDQNPQSLVMVTSLFATLLGLVLILLSNPVSLRSAEARNNMIYHCSTSSETQGLRDYYNQLLQLREQPACRAQYSIESCEGFSNGEPRYTEYLKQSEESFRCSGFCVESSSSSGIVAATQAGNSTASVKSLLEQYAAAKYPPTLFSDSNFKVSCDGAAALQLMVAARDTANQNWWLGVCFIGLSIIMGMWEWGAAAVSNPVK